MDFKQAKQKKERGVSVNEIIRELDENKDKYTDIIVITVDSDNNVDLAYSVEDDARGIGFTEIMKQHFLDNIMSEE